jgi:hypothetical protein
MSSAGRERGKKIRKRPAEGAKQQENAKKILNRGNELKDLLTAQGLAFFWIEKRTQNERNFERKMCKLKRKNRLLVQDFRLHGRAFFNPDVAF